MGFFGLAFVTHLVSSLDILRSDRSRSSLASRPLRQRRWHRLAHLPAVARSSLTAFQHRPRIPEGGGTWSTGLAYQAAEPSTGDEWIWLRHPPPRCSPGSGRWSGRGGQVVEWTGERGRSTATTRLGGRARSPHLRPGWRRSESPIGHVLIGSGQSTSARIRAMAPLVIVASGPDRGPGLGAVLSVLGPLASFRADGAKLDSGLALGPGRQLA